tara:strand:+ start:716 stop:817 length:102 start_codon:yes stop_codon:yes gene_type:complete
MVDFYKNKKIIATLEAQKSFILLVKLGNIRLDL